MSVINLTLLNEDRVCNGKQLTFITPCACTGVTGVSIGGTTYDLVNGEGNDYVSNGGKWVSGAYITVMLDVTNTKAYVINEHVDVSGLSGGSSSTYVNYTLSASSWSDNQYSFESTYPNANYDIEIWGIQSSTTEEQKTALYYADLRGSVSNNIVTANGMVPNIDIPIILKIINK